MNEHDATEALTVTLHRLLDRFEADEDRDYFVDLATRVAHIETIVSHIYLTVAALLLLAVVVVVTRLLT